MSDKSIRNLLITGAGKGLGREIARQMIAADVHIYLHYHKSNELAKQTADEIIAKGCACTLLQADLSIAKDVESMFQDVFEDAGYIDALINNAGMIKNSYFISTTEKDWDQVMDINLKSVYLCSKFAAKNMIKKRKGNIVNIISTVINRPLGMCCSYIASKAGLAGLTIAMAKEFGPFGIRVNGVSPGPIRTDMNDYTNEQWEKIIADNPMRREITAQDVAKTVSFLISNDASMINGEIIKVDGGLHL